MKELKDIVELIENADNLGVYVISRKTHHILYANRAFERFFPSYDTDCSCYQSVGNVNQCTDCKVNKGDEYNLNCNMLRNYKSNIKKGLWDGEEAYVVTLEPRNDKRDLQDEVDQSNAMMDLMTSNLNAGIKITEEDERGTFYYIGKNLLSMLGYTRAEFLELSGGNMVGAVYPPDVERAMEQYNRGLNESNEYSCEYRIRAKNGELMWILDSGRRLIYKDGIRRISSVLNDITAIKNTMDELRYQARYDELTGIYNRHTFYTETANLIHENPDKNYAIIHWDIARFKIINDLFGTAEGDKLLRYISHILYTLIDIDGTFGRFDADIFAMCIEDKDNSVEDIMNAINERLKDYPIDFEIVPCFGIYKVDRESGMTVSAMCDRANLAHRTVKGNYMNRYAVYNDKLRTDLVKEHEVTAEMNTALEEEQFEVYLQPKYNLTNETVVGAEALVRWQHPTKGMISPGVFIPIFERNGFIMKLDEYIWEHTCMILKRWKDEGKPVLPVSINISRIDLYNPHLCDIIIGLVNKYNIPPRYLELEITESAYTENLNQLMPIMKRLQDYGFIILMDDFGAGYSSLNMLKDVPVDVLKIDMNFLRGDAEQGRGGIILNSVVRMAKWLSLPVIAEGVETNTQVNFLRSIGCNDAQGFYYSRPVPVLEFEMLVKKSSYSASDIKDTEVDKDVVELWDPNSTSNIIFDNLFDAVAVYEINSSSKSIELVRANEKYFDMFGADGSDEFYGKNLAQRIYEPDRIKIFNAVENMENGRLKTIELRRCSAGGKLMWIRFNMSKVSMGHEDRDIIYASLFDITKRKNEELGAIKKTELLCRSLDNIQNGVAIYEVLDHDKLRTEFISDKVLEFMGISREEYDKNKGVSILTFIHTKDMQYVKWFLKKNDEGSEPLELITDFLRPDNTRINVRLAITVANDKEGHKFAYISVERTRNVLKYAQQSENINKLVLKNTDIIYMEYNIDTDEMIFNIAGLRHTVNNFMKNVDSLPLIDKVYQHDFALWIKKLISQKEPDSIEIIANLDGTEKMWYRAYGEFMPDGGNNNIVVYFKNIHMEKVMSDEYRRENKLLSAIMDIAPNGVFIAHRDNGFNIHYADKNFYEIYGYEKQEFKTVLNNDFLQLIHKDDIDGFLDVVDKAVQNRSDLFETEVRIKTKSGNSVYQKILIKSFNTDLFEDNAAAICGICLDRTEIKESELQYDVQKKCIKLLQDECKFIFNIDLTDNKVLDKTVVCDSILSDKECPNEYGLLMNFIKQFLHPESKEQFAQLSRRRYLLNEFGKGNTVLSYKSVGKNIQNHYINTQFDVEMYENPFNGHICCIFSGRPVFDPSDEIIYDMSYHNIINSDLIVAYKISYDDYTVERYKGVNSITDRLIDYDTFVNRIVARAEDEAHKAKLRGMLSKDNVERLFAADVQNDSFEYRRKNVDEKTIWVRLGLKLFVNEKDGTKTGYVSIVDIDTYMREREENAKLLKRYGVDFGNMCLNIWEIDCIKNNIYSVDMSDGGLNKTLLYNDSSFKEMQNRLLSRMANENDIKKCRNIASYDTINKLFSGDTDEIGDVFRLKDENGESRWTALFLKKIEWNDERKYATLFEKSVEEVYQEVETKIEEKEKEIDTLKQNNNMKNEFLLKLAHDIRSSMSIVKGACVLAEEKGAENKEAFKYLSRMDNVVEYMLMATDNIIDIVDCYNNRISVKKTHFDVQRVFNDLKDMISTYLRRQNIELEICEYADVPNDIYGDEGHVKQILVNMIVNLAKYMGANGEIVLSVDNVEESYAKKTLEFTVINKDKIDNEKNLLNVFSLTKESDTNTIIEYGGIELITVNNLVHLLDGSIDIQQVNGENIRISVQIPFDVIHKKIEKEQTAAKQYSNFNGEKILLVDDNALSREFAKIILEGLNLYVDTASTGREALEKVIESKIDSYKLILMDIRMPVMDGTEATKAIRQLPRNDVKALPIIAMSADALPENIKYSQEVGMDDYILKPVDDDTLYNILHKYLG